MAFFGGDPDNFTFPRYDLDFALFRVYENDAPIRAPHFLKWNAKGAAENELVFVTGHPGSTDRNDTVAELETQRDVIYPANIQVVKRRLAVLSSSRRAAPSRRGRPRTSSSASRTRSRPTPANTTACSIRRSWRKKTADERALRDAVGKNPEAGATATRRRGTTSARAETANRRLYKAAALRPDSRIGFRRPRAGDRPLRHRAQEAGRQRLNGYHDAQLQSTMFALLSPAPVYPALEEALLADALQESLEELGPDNPFVKTVLAGRSPKDAAAALIGGTKLADPAVRKQLIDGGEAADHGSRPIR